MPYDILEKVKSIPVKYAEEFSVYVDSFLLKINNETDLQDADMSIIDDDEARKLFDFFSGSIKREIDEKAELLEALDEKYAHLS